MTGYGGPGYDLPRRRPQSFEDSGSWGGFLHPDKAPVTEQIPRVREPEPRDREAPPPDEWRPEVRRQGAWRPEPPVREDLMAPPRPPGPPGPPAPLQPPPAPPKRGRNRLLVGAAVLGVLVLVLAGAATFILVKGDGNGTGKAAGHASASASPSIMPSVVPHVAAKGKPVAPAGAPYTYGVPAGFVVGSCSVTQSSGTAQNPSCVQPNGASTQDMVLVMNFPIKVDADKLRTADIERQLDTLYADRLHSTYQYLSIDGGRAWRTQLDGAGTTTVEVHLFKGRQHVEVLCQWTPARQQQITTGCAAVLSTLTVTG